MTRYSLASPTLRPPPRAAMGAFRPVVPMQGGVGRIASGDAVTARGAP
jgi:hypothetical protein